VAMSFPCRHDALNLISFASRDATESLAREIGALGYACRVRTGAQWAAGPPPSAASVLLIDGGVAGARAGEVISRLARAPWLCVAEAWRSEAVEALMRAATEFVESPWSRRELGLRLERIVARMLGAGPDGMEDAAIRGLAIVAEAPAFRTVLAEARRAARSGAPLTIQGETGTGKELVARAVHALGPRAKRPFVPVNCGCLPPELVENELFGHEAGAYTGAGSARGGLVQQAQGGTLFLDEVDALPLRAQVALLRFLQEGEVRAIGAGRVQGVDVRVIAASNAPLHELVREGKFRDDLYFRLNVLALEVPPLRERGADVAPLARHFLERFTRAYGLGPIEFAPEAMGWLAAQEWPGNVRQLENQVHRAVLNADGGRIGMAEMRPGAEAPERGRPDRAEYLERFVIAKTKAVEAFERHYLTQLMLHARGNVTAAAQFSGKERRALGRLLKRHGLEREAFRRGP
jgi:DNA-binding NtrC family response regulator